MKDRINMQSNNIIDPDLYRKCEKCGHLHDPVQVACSFYQGNKILAKRIK